MIRSLEQSLAWVERGTELFRSAIAGLNESSYGFPSQLQGWTRKHLVAHVAANAQAVGRLLSWASTGKESRMYSSPAQRNADIEVGAKLGGEELTGWFKRSASELAMQLKSLPPDAWQASVVTAQGRTVPAAETPWMRSRELMVHAVDLGTGLSFADLPAPFLTALCDDIAAHRSATTGTAVAVPSLSLNASDTGGRWEIAGTADPILVTGTLAAITSYLSGRRWTGIAAPTGVDVPDLPPWL